MKNKSPSITKPCKPWPILVDTIFKLTLALTIHEKGKFLSQHELNPKCQWHSQTSSVENQNMSKVKLVITICSGKVVKKHILDPHEIGKELISESKKESKEPLTH